MDSVDRCKSAAASPGPRVQKPVTESKQVHRMQIKIDIFLFDTHGTDSL